MRSGFLFAAVFCFCASVQAQQPPFGLTERIPVSPLAFPVNAPASGTASIELARVFSGLSFTQPLFITAPRDGSGRLFVVEKTGTIKVFANRSDTSTTSIFLDLSTIVATESEQGLLGLAFDPGFTRNGLFYVYYSLLSPRRSVVSRFKVSSDPNVADRASERVIIEIPQPESFGNHKGGMLAFGTDGMLYIGVGDGGSGGDPLNNGQNCANMLATILRINPNAGSPYAIPSDNPYAGSARYNCGNLTGAPSRVCGINGYAAGEICREIWANGVRNPWRFSIDQTTGTLWLGDVGQNAYEEVNIVRAGNNLGWRYFEGTHPFNNPNNLPLSQFTAPILDYPRSEGGSVTGGYVYRGQEIPEIYGKYVYGDFGSGKVWLLEYDGSRVVANDLIGTPGGITSFGEDENGEIYTVSLVNGRVYRLRRRSGQVPDGVVPTNLSQTGLFANTAQLIPAAGIIEYDVNAPLWSDGALKRRWIALPGQSTISFDPTLPWQFPPGTALVKHFDLRLSALSTRRLETRVLFLHTEGWAGYTYKWNEAQTDAELLTNGTRQTYSVQDSSSPGGFRLQEWTYPSRSDCLSCHTAPSGYVLGVNTRQLNRDFSYPAARDNQLRSWDHISLFSSRLSSPASYSAYTTGYGANAGSVDSRARSYLASNCANCHQPGVPRSEVIDLRYDTPLVARNLVGVRPTFGDLGLTDPFRVKAGSKESSVLWHRVSLISPDRMPPLASSVVDAEGVSLLGEWIDAVVGQTPKPLAPARLRVVP